VTSTDEVSAAPAATPPPDPVAPGPVRKRVVVIGGAVAALVVAGAGAVAYATAGDIPRGTTVLGVGLGAKSRAAAERALHDAFDARAAEPVEVRLDGRSVTVAPRDIAMTLDVAATAGAAARRGLFADRAVAPVVRLDEGRLETVLRKSLDPARITFRKPAITYTEVTPVPSYPRAGLDLDLTAAATGVRNAWLTHRPAVAALAERRPAMPDEQVDALVNGLATTAVAALVTVTTGAGSFVLSPAAIAKGLVFRSDSAGRLAPAIDGAKLRAAAPDEFAKVETAPQEATIAFAGGKPRIVAGTAGEVVDMTRLSADLLAVLPGPAPRGVTATLVEQAAPTTDAEMAALGVKERVSTFTTYFTGGARSPRSQNIVTIAKEVDGAIVRPGETFSLNGHTGERDYAAGYRDAPVIVGGKLEPGVGGGASQFTTTLFNTAYYAGLQDVEHKPHSFYFSRYPSVIESTIFYPTLDLKFKNTTPYGILIDTSTTGRSVTVSMWSTKYYDSVKTERSPRRNATSPPTVYREPGPKCISSSGLPGFSQDAWRIIRKDGKEIEREKFTWRYDPEPRFVCGAQP
jgi:vancomycin resistance protein YoaR